MVSERQVERKGSRVAVHCQVSVEAKTSGAIDTPNYESAVNLKAIFTPEGHVKEVVESMKKCVVTPW